MFLLSSIKTERTFSDSGPLHEYFRYKILSHLMQSFTNHTTNQLKKGIKEWLNYIVRPHDVFLY